MPIQSGQSTTSSQGLQKFDWATARGALIELSESDAFTSNWKTTKQDLKATEGFKLNKGIIKKIKRGAIDKISNSQIENLYESSSLTSELGLKTPGMLEASIDLTPSIKETTSSDHSNIQTAAQGANKHDETKKPSFLFIEMFYDDPEDREEYIEKNKKAYDEYLKACEKWNKEHPDDPVTPSDNAPEGWEPKKNNNPMNDNHIDPSIEDTYGPRISTPIKNHTIDRKELIEDLDPISDPTDEHKNSGPYTGPSITEVIDSHGGTSTGSWGDSNVGGSIKDELATAVAVIIDSNIGTSTGSTPIFF